MFYIFQAKKAKDFIWLLKNKKFMPKVSVIIPTYNRADLLPRTIRSVLDQTFGDFELLIIDDGSTDSTKSVVQEYANQDKRIKYIYQNNSGAPARPKNTGIKAAEGEYIAFLDHDDEWLPGKLEKQLAVFNSSYNKNLGLVGCDGFVVNSSGAVVKELKMPSKDNYVEGLLNSNFIFSSSSVLVRKDVFDKVGLHDESFKMGDDWDMWLRISQAYDLDFIHQPLFKYHQHGNNISKLILKKEKIEEYERELKKYSDLYRSYPNAYSKKLIDIGRLYFFAGNPGKARRYFLNSVAVSPLKLKTYANLFISLLGSKSYVRMLRLRTKK